MFSIITAFLSIIVVYGCEDIELMPQYGASIKAIHKWNDTYIEKTLGDKLFNVFDMKDKYDFISHDWYTEKKMNFSNYLINKNSYILYQKQKYLGDLYEDLEHHDSDDLMAEHVFIGDHGTDFHIHLHKHNALYCQIRGKKDLWHLIIENLVFLTWYIHMID